tara:strand:- start:4857 stop:4964 length:108 start_codon:yes stop_codon:yes gene_type:complete
MLVEIMKKVEFNDVAIWILIGLGVILLVASFFKGG